MAEWNLSSEFPNRKSLPDGAKVRVSRISLFESALELVTFLEARVGSGTIAQCRLCTHRASGQLNGSAIVIFKTQQPAEDAIRFAKSGLLFFRDSKLTVWPTKVKKNQRRNDGVTEVDNVILHSGCLTQKDTLYKLWTCQAAKIQVDNDSKRFRVIIHNSSRIVYKLEWCFREIHEFCRANLKGGRGGQSFMLKVWNTPKIFEKTLNALEYFCEGFFEFPFEDSVWVRTTDFSPEASIGQSFVYCLEIPREHKLALDFFINTGSEFPLQENKLMIKNGVSYTLSVQTVPILNSAYIDVLPFELVFLVNSLVQHGFLSGPTLSWSFFSLLKPSREMPLRYIMHVLEQMRREQDTCFEPERWFHLERQKFLKQAWKEKRMKCPLDDGLMMVRKVFVTPSRVYYAGPEVEVSNRVTRHFRDHIQDFIRVAFVEEDMDMIPAGALVVPRNQREHSKVYDRIISVLNDGIRIGEKEFEFLAFSSSQLRENSLWMFSSTASVSAEEIRNWMGDFVNIRNTAKCASRMGQSFSSSTKSLDVPLDEIEKIPDIWNITHTYCFSDGIGKISLSFATQVAKKCKIRNNARVPSLYQIRYGGYKGVVAVDPRSPHKLSLRPSMCKFKSLQISLDILNWSRALPSYLNREIITLLSTLGVQDLVFEKMQQVVMKQLDKMLESREVALAVIQDFCREGRTEGIVVEMLSAGFHPAKEPFLMRMLHAFRAFQLMNLRKKSHIFVPKGRLLMGCLDETRTLEYGQVFVSLSSTSKAHKTIYEGLKYDTVYGIDGVPQNVCIAQGRVIVAKNPCLHPGDVRVLTAVDVPSLHHLVDCLVFPQKGHRSHPSECSGSDLDGDLYFVSWDENLIPPSVHDPQDYKPAEEQELECPVTPQDIIKYFADFMLNNSLGLICNAHVVFADLSPRMACDPKCLQLARLGSIAVDFPKTGVVDALPMELRPGKYPDFMEKTDKPEYKSERVLGKLFRAVVEADKEERISSFTKREAAKCYDKELEVDGFEHYLEDAEGFKNCYDGKLLDLMYQYDVKSEAELFTGYILSISRWFRKRHSEVKERIMIAMKSLRKEARSWLKDDNEYSNDSDDDDSIVSHEQLAKASAWYYVTYHPSYVSEHVEDKHGWLLSFPWVVYDKLAMIKKARL